MPTLAVAAVQACALPNYKATLAGLFGAHPGGTVSFKLFDNDQCEGAPLATDGPVDVSANGDYEAPHSPIPSGAGAYYCAASYSGDHDTKGAVWDCADDPVAIGLFSNDTSTTELYALSLHDALPIYKATLAGLFGAHPGGTVSFKLFDNDQCEGAPLATDGPVDVSANGD